MARGKFTDSLQRIVCDAHIITTQSLIHLQTYQISKFPGFNEIKRFQS